MKISMEPADEFKSMHEDVTHAVKLTIKQGIEDPDRIAIMGGSFGGYLAMCGAAFEPDLYQCAITVVGVFDWELMIKSDKRNEHNYRRQSFLKRLGDPKERKDYFTSISPIHHIDKVKIPIFIAHGNSDSNVSVLQSKQLRSKLKENGVPYEAHFKEWEGHGFSDPKNKVELYENIEAFLAENL
jgi:dipeptidyl aminopeptidase/acylaminoacyl peptidase